MKRFVSIPMNNDIADFLFEASTLKRLKRTGFQILGGLDESIAEHCWSTTLIGYVLADLAQADTKKVVFMLLFHDLPEVRMGDQPQDYENKKPILARAIMTR